MKTKKFKYQINLLRNTNETLVLVKKITIKNLNSNLVKVDKDKTFSIDFRNASFLSNYIYQYFVDIDSGTQYQFTAILSKIDAHSLDLMFSTSIIRQMMGSLSSESKLDWIQIISYLSLGIGIGALVVYAIMQSKIDELLELIMDYQSFNPPLPF